ncbi:class I lanthipeptide [Taibaiella chishuiensis]|uniref:Uncharacterized protein n=1 Tax=Taibaiella chishuiensis TaxID=1434707 RepID=A0A2P8D7S3_9BACT|nr:class I lanthipeptide [Taibaiella chishuiensis]PSK93280.1 hypothetical protein B0I18_102250 [Taibaiella chishuiensis]
MKKVNQTANSKLQFRKEAIVNLNRSEMSHVQGGEAAWTTSFGKCSGFLCCSPSKSKELIKDIIDNITNDCGGNNTPQ